MTITINESDPYHIRGKIIEIRNSTLLIFVTSPFTCEIKFYCSSEHYDILHPPVLSDNPSLVTNNSNTIQHQKEYQFFQYRYMSVLQKEQSCEFSAYAIRKEDRRSVHSQQVERHPDDYDYFWIYDPDSFCGKKWDEASIDDLVKEIRPSRATVEHLSESYEADDQEVKREERKRKWQEVKSTPKRLQNWLDEYDKLMIAVITLVSGAVGVELIKVIIKIITPSEN